ncbi:hypothetical protein DB30_03012 [Enhygromyxa salina]|uniref:HEAT repeat protein n=1 Tax=Enhygromyxa salina TaxID=215803 RepID=A0A0C2DDM6_9BACT|nr:TIGR02270 family protein [Enhygromyxa salina]KIG17737.1 hypothetical protein DB30_03012 [Enhygromyxa salina]
MSAQPSTSDISFVNRTHSLCDTRSPCAGDRRRRELEVVRSGLDAMTVATDFYQLAEHEILWDDVTEHLDEAEFLFELWEAALDAPNYTLAEVAAGPERRLLAHIDGLQVGGPAVAERLLFPTVENPGSYYGKVVAAALACQHPERVLKVLVGAADEEQRRGIIKALELSDDASLNARVVQVLDSSRGGVGCAALLEVLARRRAPVGSWVGHLLGGDDPGAALAAARLVRYCSDRQVLEGLAPLAQSDDAGLRFAAVETALIRQVPGAWESAVYWAFIPVESPFRRDAMVWVALLGDAAAQQHLLGLVDSPEHRADALWALGFSGRVSAVDRCIELLGDDEIAPLAAEVVCAIAGLSTEDDRFWRAPPPPDGEGQTLPRLQDDDLNRDLIPTAEAGLQIPEPEPTARWWQERRPGFEPSLRYIGGRALTGRVLVDALWRAPMRRRHNLALELGLRTGGTVMVGTRALSGPQQAQLAELAELEAIDFQRGMTLR